MHIRPYRSSDCPALAELFYQTVHAVNARDYSPEQLDAWADGRVELAAWDASFRAHDTRVAVEGGVIVGFADLGPDGYLDRLYVHRDWQGRGGLRPSATPSPPPAPPTPPSPPGPSLSGGAGVWCGSSRWSAGGCSSPTLSWSGHARRLPALCRARLPDAPLLPRSGRPPPPFFPVQAGLA